MAATKIRVLLISVRADFGGGPEHINCLLEHFPREVHTFIACSQDYPYWKRYADIVGLERMIKIPHRRFKLSAVWQLKGFVEKNNIELIHSHGKGAGLYGRLLAKLTKIPCIHTFHGVHTGEYSFLKRLAYVWVERQLSRLTKHVISVSHGEAEQVKRLRLCDPRQLIVVPNGVRVPTRLDATTLSFGQADSKKKQRANVCKIIHFTRFNYQKNSELIFSIWKGLIESGIADHFRLLVLGQGPGQREFENQLEKLHWQEYIQCLGAVQNTEEYLEHAFCYLSTSRWEGMPLAVLEAMVMGVPVIATDVVGNKDVVDDGRTGFLYNPDAPQQAVAHLNDLLNNKQRWQALSSAARAKIQRDYSAERMSQRTAEVYETVLSAKKSMADCNAESSY